MYGILKDEQEAKFKVGDRVRVVKGGAGGSWHMAEIGSVGIVTEDIERGYRRDDGWYFKPDKIELATVLASFKVGDRVRVTKHSGYFAIGDKGEVERQDDNVVYVKHGSYQRIGLPIDADALELVVALGASNDNRAAPKFKAGDKVVCLKNCEGQFTKGRYYTVRNDVPDDGKSFVSVIRDDAGSISNGWCQEHFVAAPAAQPCIVARVVDGTPRPSNVPFVHEDAASATAEAERLATNNPGQEFAVYQRVAGRVAEVSYNMKEVA